MEDPPAYETVRYPNQGPDLASRPRRTENNGRRGIPRVVQSRTISKIGRRRSRSQRESSSIPLWKPVSLRLHFLLSVIAVSAALIVVLQVLQVRSRRDGGVLFAPSINDLPLTKTFAYLYLPTIIAVCYGFLWSWIDLDVRRIEPFLQLSKDEGATGKESLLLHYPVDFLASVPIRAMRYGHWTVFTSSIATVIIFWGVTPTQAGIFAIDTLNKTADFPLARSTEYLSLAKQKETLSAQSAHSVANIMWLNETLQPFMTRDYLLAPFGLTVQDSKQVAQGLVTGNTNKYSVDVNCEVATPWKDNMVNSTWGCSFSQPAPRRGPANLNESKTFDTLYVGYSNDDGNADYYLSGGSCPPSQSNTIYIQWSQALIPPSNFFNLTGEEQRPHSNVTALWCRSEYYVEEVEATIELPGNAVVGQKLIGPRRPLPADLFNSSNFEASMSVGQDQDRTDFPTMDWPTQSGFLMQMPLNLNYLPKMAPFAIGATQLPLNEYLDPTTFGNSYQAAYRLLFARQLSTVLSKELNPQLQGMGRWNYRTQSLMLVPAFTYIVEGLLGLAIIFASLILYYSCRRKGRLHSDPATIASVMSLAADDRALLRKMKSLDQASARVLNSHIRNRRFQLVPATGTNSSFHIKLLDLRANADLEAINDEIQSTNQQQTFSSTRNTKKGAFDVVSGIQPQEFSLKIGLAFLALQIGLFAVIATLFILILRGNGLPLPSKNQFVRQLLENYLPTAVGTFIEPFWVVLNRHLCFLQPFDELRRGRSEGHRSIGLEYLSLPPQLAIWKAFSKGNFLLGIVCAMTLLANALAISLSGLFFENSVDLNLKTTFKPLYASQFKALDGAAPAFTTDVGSFLENFYVTTSNRTATTPRPPWTDDKFFYFPFAFDTAAVNQTWQYRAVTSAIGASLTCQPLSARSTFALRGTQPDDFGFYSISATGNLTVSLSREDGTEIICVPRGTFRSAYAHFNHLPGELSTGPSAYEFAYTLEGSANSSKADASLCREHVSAGWVRADVILGTLPPALNGSDQIPYIITSYNSTIITCRATVVGGSADIIVDAQGRVQKRVSQGVSSKQGREFLTTTSSDLFGQMNQLVLDNVMTLHNDSFPSDFLNYLMEKATNDSAPLNPNFPPPAFETVVPSFSALYSQLFATVVGRNMDQLLEPVKTGATLAGFTVQPKTRIFMSTIMFVLAETILALYIIVTITLYVRRPWKILCRMPTSLASIIAFFAASHAVNDFQGTAGLTAGQMREHEGKLDDRYGFGTFIGTDGRTHIGIEKHPFLAPLTRERSDLVRKDTMDSSMSARERWKHKFLNWKSGKAREGGWI